MDSLALPLSHVGLTWFLTGLIWVVQVVHYPLFDHVARDAFPAFERQHSRRITGVVAPTMLGELVTGALLVLVAPSPVLRVGWGMGLALIVAIWASTLFFQVPCHQRLAGGFDRATHRRLVRTNWLRTVLWSLRAVLVLALLVMTPG